MKVGTYSFVRPHFHIICEYLSLKFEIIDHILK